MREYEVPATQQVSAQLCTCRETANCLFLPRAAQTDANVVAGDLMCPFQGLGLCVLVVLLMPQLQANASKAGDTNTCLHIHVTALIMRRRLWRGHRHLTSRQPCMHVLTH